MNEPRKSRIAFGTRHLLMLVAFFAVVSGWWVDRHRLQRQVHRSDRENIAAQHRALEAQERLSALRIDTRSQNMWLESRVKLQQDFINRYQGMLSEHVKQADDPTLVEEFEGTVRQLDAAKRVRRIP